MSDRVPSKLRYEADEFFPGPTRSTALPIPPSMMGPSYPTGQGSQQVNHMAFMPQFTVGPGISSANINYSPLGQHPQNHGNTRRPVPVPITGPGQPGFNQHDTQNSAGVESSRRLNQRAPRAQDRVIGTNSFGDVRAVDSTRQQQPVLPTVNTTFTIAATPTSFQTVITAPTSSHSATLHPATTSSESSTWPQVENGESSPSNAQPQHFIHVDSGEESESEETRSSPMTSSSSSSNARVSSASLLSRRSQLLQDAVTAAVERDEKSPALSIADLYEREIRFNTLRGLQRGGDPGHLLSKRVLMYWHPKRVILYWQKHYKFDYALCHGLEQMAKVESLGWKAKCHKGDKKDVIMSEVFKLLDDDEWYERYDLDQPQEWIDIVKQWRTIERRMTKNVKKKTQKRVDKDAQQPAAQQAEAPAAEQPAAAEQAETATQQVGAAAQEAPAQEAAQLAQAKFCKPDCTQCCSWYLIEEIIRLCDKDNKTKEARATIEKWFPGLLEDHLRLWEEMHQKWVGANAHHDLVEAKAKEESEEHNNQRRLMVNYNRNKMWTQRRCLSKRTSSLPFLFAAC